MFRPRSYTDREIIWAKARAFVWTITMLVLLFALVWSFWVERYGVFVGFCGLYFIWNIMSSGLSILGTTREPETNKRSPYDDSLSVPYYKFPDDHEKKE